MAKYRISVKDSDLFKMIFPSVSQSVQTPTNVRLLAGEFLQRLLGRDLSAGVARSG